MRSRRRVPGSRRAQRLVAAVFAVLAVVGVGVYMSGPMSPAIIVGDSMEPRLSQGDLAIIRQATEYKVGDVVAYQHPDVGLLIHRIIAVDDGSAGLDAGSGRPILQGDNRAQPDAYHPLLSDVQGQLLLSMPGAGSMVDWIRQPLGIGILAVIISSSALFPLMRKRERRQRVGKRLTRGAQTPRGRQLAIMFGVVGLTAAAGLGVLRMVEPTQEVANDFWYQHTGTFSYAAAGGGGGDGVYDTGFAETGDPLFRALFDTVDLRFDYQFEAMLPAPASGTTRLLARISQSNGWSRTVELSPATPFNQNAFTLESVLDLSAMQRLIDQVEEQTGVVTRTYRLSVLAEVDTEATLAGEPVTDHFVAELPFAMDLQLLQLVPTADGGAPLVQGLGGTVTTFQTVERTFGVFGISLKTADAQRLATIVLVLSAVGLIIMGGLILRGSRPGEAETIRAQYRHLLVPARIEQFPESMSVVEVSRFMDLVKLAEAEGLPIFDETNPFVDRFLLLQRDATYSYRTAGRQPTSVRSGRVEAA